MAGKNRKLGPRATVLFKSGQGQGRGAKSQYVYMLRSAAEKLGLKVVPDATVTRKAAKGSKGKESKVAVRGSVGAKHIKVVLGGSRQDANAQGRNTGTKNRYVSVPVPGDATISDIKKFLQGASKKPTQFVSPGGRTYSVSATR